MAPFLQLDVSAAFVPCAAVNRADFEKSTIDERVVRTKKVNRLAESDLHKLRVAAQHSTDHLVPARWDVRWHVRPLELQNEVNRESSTTSALQIVCLSFVPT